MLFTRGSRRRANRSAPGRTDGIKPVPSPCGRPGSCAASSTRNSAIVAIRLTGIGIASRLPLEASPHEPPEVIAGTLAYMTPEQTGPMILEFGKARELG
jgi:hypothetical protein